MTDDFANGYKYMIPKLTAGHTEVCEYWTFKCCHWISILKQDVSVIIFYHVRLLICINYNNLPMDFLSSENVAIEMFTSEIYLNYSFCFSWVIITTPDVSQSIKYKACDIYLEIYYFSNQLLANRHMISVLVERTSSVTYFTVAQLV